MAISVLGGVGLFSARRDRDDRVLGTLIADTAIVGVDTLRSLETPSHHAWRSVAHLVGVGE
jgi:phosphate:Na+ symporter